MATRLFKWSLLSVPLTVLLLLQDCATSNGVKTMSVEKKPLHDRVVVCYVASWAVYRSDNGAFSVENINPSLCTHIVYAFAGLNISTNSIYSLDEFNDLEDNYGKGTFKKITSLKRTHPHLKVSLAIGGWNEGSANYSLMASTPTRRRQFIDSVVQILKKHNFDGLDLDWEYPGLREGKPEDKQNFVYLVQELRQEFNKYNWILTAALGASKSVIDTAYDIPSLSRYLDLIHVMCYDYHGTWDKMVGPNAPLYGRNEHDFLSVEYTIKYLLQLGASKDKLVMGLPLYGRTFISSDPSQAVAFGVSAEEKGFQGQFTKEDGYMGYNEICLELNAPNSTWEKHWDERSGTPYAVQGRKVIVYDDPKSLALKVKHAMENDLAGVMVWPMDTDDFTGECRKAHGYPDYPLLRSINEAIVSSLADIENRINEIQTQEEKRAEQEKAKGHNGASTSVVPLTLCVLPVLLSTALRK